MTPDEVSLWIVAFRRLDALCRTVNDWLASFPFENVNIIANDPLYDYSQLYSEFPRVVKWWPNMFRSGWETGSIAWCWNQCMKHTFETRRWCLMSQDDVAVLPGWDKLITEDYLTYVAPVGDTIQLQSVQGFASVGWYDERFRAIGGPEADYLLRMYQAYPKYLSAHDEHVWQWRHNDVGLAEYWHGAEKHGEVGQTRREFNEKFAAAECFARWNQKWGVHVDERMSRPDGAVRQPGWEEIDWYPSFTARLRAMGRM